MIWENVKGYGQQLNKFLMKFAGITPTLDSIAMVQIHRTTIPSLLSLAIGFSNYLHEINVQSDVLSLR